MTFDLLVDLSNKIVYVWIRIYMNKDLMKEKLN